MTTQRAVLIDEKDTRVGRLLVPPSCFIIKHKGAFFVRTAKMVRPIPSVLATAVVFEQTEPYVRDKLEPM